MGGPGKDLRVWLQCGVCSQNNSELEIYEDDYILGSHSHFAPNTRTRYIKFQYRDFYTWVRQTIFGDAFPDSNPKVMSYELPPCHANNRSTQRKKTPAAEWRHTGSTQTIIYTSGDKLQPFESYAKLKHKPFSIIVSYLQPREATAS